MTIRTRSLRFQTLRYSFGERASAQAKKIEAKEISVKTFSTRTIINSSPEVIWTILTEASKWPEWNTTVDKVEGKIAPGEKITVFAKANPGRAFPLTVSEFVPAKRMVWTGGMPLGLFKGERTFTLTRYDDGRVEFTMREVFSGLMSPLIVRSIPDLQPSFDEFAARLKEHAESGR